MSKGWCGAVPRGVRIFVQITPNAKKSEVVGVLDDALKIKLQAQPIEGKANEALVRFLADMLDVPRSAVAITHGLTARRKTVEVAAGATVDSVIARLAPLE
jgi:uncharacterized protein (TIGR00251 family)